MKGAQPGTDLLAALARTDRVDLDWLLLDKGVPYRVTRAMNDQYAITAIDKLLQAEDYGVAITHTADDSNLGVILHRRTEYDFKDKSVDYTEAHVFVAGVSMATVHWLNEQGRGLWALLLSEKDMQRLENGHMGNNELFGFEDARKQRPGLMSKVKPSPYKDSVNEVREPGTEYQVLDNGSQSMAMQYQQLSTDNKNHVKAITEALLLSQKQQ
ncbi:hypothetical protein R50073_24390 [Maricurvus nonylphenolicus]